MFKTLKDEKWKTVFNAITEIAKEPNRKPSKLRVNQEFYNISTQEWQDRNDILMYSTHNEGKSVVARRFLRALKVKVYEKNDS